MQPQVYVSDVLCGDQDMHDFPGSAYAWKRARAPTWQMARSSFLQINGSLAARVGVPHLHRDALFKILGHISLHWVRTL